MAVLPTTLFRTSYNHHLPIDSSLPCCSSSSSSSFLSSFTLLVLQPPISKTPTTRTMTPIRVRNLTHFPFLDDHQFGCHAQRIVIQLTHPRRDGLRHVVTNERRAVGGVRESEFGISPIVGHEVTPLFVGPGARKRIEKRRIGIVTRVHNVWIGVTSIIQLLSEPSVHFSCDVSIILTVSALSKALFDNGEKVEGEGRGRRGRR